MIEEKELMRRIKAARLVDCADPEAAVMAIICKMPKSKGWKVHGAWLSESARQLTRAEAKTLVVAHCAICGKPAIVDEYCARCGAFMGVEEGEANETD